MDKNWYKHYDPDVPHTIDPDQYTSFVQMMEEMFNKHSHKPCFTNFNTSLSYRQVDILSQRFAGYLQSECGCAKGDRIAMLMLNTLQYPVAILGALRAGLIVVGISPLAKPDEVHRIVNETEPKCILVLSNLAPVLESAFAISSPSSIKHIIVSHLGDLLGFFKGPFVNFIAKRKLMTPRWNLPNTILFKKTILAKYYKVFSKPAIESQDIAFLSHTSGRDGPLPKCVMLTHRNLVATVLQIKAHFTPFFESRNQGGFLVILPLYHPSNFLFSMTMLCEGYASSLITNPRDIRSIINDMKTHAYFGTLCISRLLKALLLDEEIKNANFSNFQFIAGWGGFFGIDLFRLKTLTGITLMDGYGNRESQICAGNPYSIKTLNTKIGLPLSSVEAKICDVNGKELPANARGELWIRGPQVMKGYWKDPELTQSVLTEDGWFKTGDIMTIDDNGFLSFIDRKTDLIMTAIGPVYPSDIESVIALIEGIQEVMVVGLNSNHLDEKTIKAFIVKNDNAITAGAVIAHCIKYLLKHQIPHEVEFRDELPKTDIGYAFRRLLREEGSE
jgi:long-chain acyl-CoA synthetase